MRLSPIQPPDRPQGCRWIERTQRRRPVRTLGQIEHVVVDIAETAEDLASGRRTLEFDPFATTRKARFETAVMDAPIADEEIEVVRTGRVPIGHDAHVQSMNHCLARSCRRPGTTQTASPAAAVFSRVRRDPSLGEWRMVVLRSEEVLPRYDPMPDNYCQEYTRSLEGRCPCARAVCCRS